jgi:BioD-like phosphotransacetylase family protein
MKPLTTRIPQTSSSEQTAGQPAVAPDTEFVRQELALTEPWSDIVPVALSPAMVQEMIQATPTTDHTSKLHAAYERVSVNKDVLILEGEGHPFQGVLFGLSSVQVAEQLDARVLVAVRYNDSLSIDTAAGLPMIYGQRLLGVVINAVPRTHMRFVRRVARPALESRNVPVFAVLPEDRLLSSVSVQELIDHLGGEVLCCEGVLDQLVEYIMVGAMTAESALTYFRGRPNKAVITGGDRHDLQLAALETSTRCLILTGGQHPSPVVLSRAREVSVPIVVVEPDTLTTVQAVQKVFGKTSLNQSKKCALFESILKERFDFARFYDVLGLTNNDLANH